MQFPFFEILGYRNEGDKMKSILAEISCNNCMYHTYRKSETLILPDFEPRMRKELLEDTYFTYVCPRCGHTITYLHELTYVDKAHHFILLIKPKVDQKERDHNLYLEDTKSIRRYISDPTLVSEKLRILEDEVDDRVIEILKFKLKIRYTRMNKEVKHIAYQDCANDLFWFSIAFIDSEEMIAVASDSYQTIKKSLDANNHKKFIEIDEDWIRNKRISENHNKDVK